MTRFTFIIAVACNGAPSDTDRPKDTLVVDPRCNEEPVRVVSGRVEGLPLFSSDPYLRFDRTPNSVPVLLPDGSRSDDWRGEFTWLGPDNRWYGWWPDPPVPPGATLFPIEPGCPGQSFPIHPAGLPVNAADLDGRTWVLHDATDYDILTTAGAGDDFPTSNRFRPRFTAGSFPLFLHADVNDAVVTWSLAAGDLEAAGAPNPCRLPTPLTSAAPFNGDAPRVRIPVAPDITLGGSPSSLTLRNPSLEFTPAPAGDSVAVVRLTATLDMRELAEVAILDFVPPDDVDWCEGAILYAPSGTTPTCTPCEGTPSGYCTDRALIILEAPAVDVPWPTEASIAADPRCASPP